MTKNILINCLSAASGGGVAYIKNLIPGLLQEIHSLNNFKVYLLVYSDQVKLIPVNDSLNSVEFIVLNMRPMPGYKRIYWEIINIKQMIERYQLSVIFNPYQMAPIISGVMNIVMITNMEPFTFQNYSYSFKGWLRNFILKIATIKTLRNADKVISISDYVHNFLIKNNIATEHNTTMIYNGRDESYSSVHDQEDEAILKNMGIESEYIFTCGSLLPYRKCEDIITAFKKLKITEDYKLIIAGTGSENKYLEKLKRLILGDSNIKMLGFVSQEQMKVLYKHSKLFVMASETEACPNIAIEAMSCGCNILSSDVMPMPEIFADSATYFKHSNVNDLLDKMRYCILDSVKTDNVNVVAVDRAKDFSWKVTAKLTCSLLTEK